MIKKILPLFSILILIGCNASKPVIITKKPVSHTAKKETKQALKKLPQQRNILRKSKIILLQK